MDLLKLESLALRFNYSQDLKSCDYFILDQTLLPQNETWIKIKTTEMMIDAIKKLQVRGAPLIGVAATLSLAQSAIAGATSTELLTKAQHLYEARPTAVNLMVCIDRMRSLLKNDSCLISIVNLAVQIFNEDVDLCHKISRNGAELIEDGDQILTHCNTGGLATAGIGTALGVIKIAHESGKKIHVYVDETRPLLQGARLTAWELQKLNIPMTLITDNMAAHLMQQKKITKAIVGSDRIAQNGDFANKIGTYSVAVNCFYHHIPFYVAAPYTTIDFECVSGETIPIEQRSASEVTGATGHFGSINWSPEKCAVYNPAFDVTPAKLTTAWITDRGVYSQKDIDLGVFKLKDRGNT